VRLVLDVPASSQLKFFDNGHRWRTLAIRALSRTDPFIGPEGYRAFIDRAEAEFRSGRAH